MEAFPTTNLFLALYVICFIVSDNSHLGIASIPCDTASDPSWNKHMFCNASLDMEERVQDLIKQVSHDEKMFLLTDRRYGFPSLGIAEYNWWSEGSNGIIAKGLASRFTELVPGATIFPVVLSQAASFNLSVFESVGRAISTEARAMYNLGLVGITFWNPTVNPVVDPRWGYSLETPGEDPFLASKYASTYVRAFQGQDAAGHLKVAACCREFLLESFDSEKFNLINPQDMADTYQPPLESCIVDGKSACVMCSYKPINGKYSCADPKLMQGLIRDKWNFNGYIISHCSSFDNVDSKQVAADSIMAGQDLGCGDFWYRQVEGAISSKLLNESYIDRAISNTMMTLFRLGLFDGSPQSQTYGYLGAKDVCSDEHQQLAKEAARQGIVMLKNEAGSLPLSKTAIRSLAVVGPNANTRLGMLGTYSDNPCNYSTPLDALEKVVDTVYHIEGCNIVCPTIPNPDDIRKVVAAADATVLIVGTDVIIDGRGFDRESLLLPGQQPNLITTAADASTGPVILVILSGGGFDIAFAKENEKIKSILWVGYPGEAGGDAIADVIFGEYNPSGKLPITWYPEDFTKKVQMDDFSMRPDFATGYPGRTYRFFTGDPVYSFGDGLSYTSFDYDLLQAAKGVMIPAKFICSNCSSFRADTKHCQSLAFNVSLRIQNIGKMSGSHAVLLFSNPPYLPDSPKKHLIAFEKIWLTPKEAKSIEFKLDVCKDLAVADHYGDRRVHMGMYFLQAGNLKYSLCVGKEMQPGCGKVTKSASMSRKPVCPIVLLLLCLQALLCFKL